MWKLKARCCTSFPLLHDSINILGRINRRSLAMNASSTAEEDAIKVIVTTIGDIRKFNVSTTGTVYIHIFRSDSQTIVLVCDSYVLFSSNIALVSRNHCVKSLASLRFSWRFFTRFQSASSSPLFFKYNSDVLSAAREVSAIRRCWFYLWHSFL